MSNRFKKNPTKLVDDIFEGFKAQTVTVPGISAAEIVISQMSATIRVLLEQRKTIIGQVEELLADFPLVPRS